MKHGRWLQFQVNLSELGDRMIKRFGAVVAYLALTGCVMSDQQRSGYCESGAEGDVFVRSAACNGPNVGDLQCGDRSGPFQRILIINRTTNAAAVTINYSDGTSEQKLIKSWDSYQVYKPYGMGASVTAQC